MLIKINDSAYINPDQVLFAEPISAQGPNGKTVFNIVFMLNSPFISRKFKAKVKNGSAPKLKNIYEKENMLLFSYNFDTEEDAVHFLESNFCISERNQVKGLKH